MGRASRPTLHEVPDATYCHEARFYHGVDDLAEWAAGFVRDGLARDEAILVALPAARLAAVREALGDDAGAVEFADMETAGRNPGRLVGVWRQFIDGTQGRAARGIGEPVWRGRAPDELAECRHHEALLNVAFSPRTPFWLVCPYDTATLDGATLADAVARHPHLSGRMPAGDGAYDPATVTAALSDPLPAAPAHAEEHAFGRRDLTAVRRLVAARLRAGSIPAVRAAEIVLAVHEVAANSICHGGGDGVLRLWHEDERIVIEVEDAGTVRDPLVGRRPPPPIATGGRGVWLAHQLCDLVQLRSGADGTTVRMAVAAA
jgi:anti-sigma regulatory factor (Ser/Thr protein kinase)